MRVVELRTGFDSSVVIHLISRICQDVIDKSDRCFLTASVVCVLVSVQLNYSHSFSFVFSFDLTTPKVTQNEANQNCGSGRTVSLRFSSSQSAGTGYCYASVCGMMISVAEVYLD